MNSGANIARLTEVLTFLVHQSRRRLGRTMLQKLAYLADVESQRRRGKSITGLDYVAYDHGPWLPELYDALALATEIRERRYLWSSGAGYEYQPSDGVPEYSYLDETDREILGSVVEEWGGRALGEVLAHVYSTTPYKGTGFGERVPLESVGQHNR